MKTAEHANRSDPCHAWFEDPAGFPVTDWELAIEGDARNRPVHWRRLRTGRPEDARVLAQVMGITARRRRDAPLAA